MQSPYGNAAKKVTLILSLNRRDSIALMVLLFFFIFINYPVYGRFLKEALMIGISSRLGLIAESRVRAFGGVGTPGNLNFLPVEASEP